MSQPSIKKNILGDFYDMSKNRQVIIITHNPQFIVNLDVDNVIFIGKDENDKIIYVGKAISLKNRVRQYFQSSKNHSSKVKSMVKNKKTCYFYPEDL